MLDRVKMPSKKGFCWCFGGRAPPEITYGIENGAMTIKQIEMDAPMPQDEEELNAMFAELVVSIFVLELYFLVCGIYTRTKRNK